MPRLLPYFFPRLVIQSLKSSLTGLEQVIVKDIHNYGKATKSVVRLDAIEGYIFIDLIYTSALLHNSKHPTAFTPTVLGSCGRNAQDTDIRHDSSSDNLGDSLRRHTTGLPLPLQW